MRRTLFSMPGSSSSWDAFAHIHHQRGAANFARLHRQFGKARDQFHGKIVDTVIAQILKRLEHGRLARAAHARDDHQFRRMLDHHERRAFFPLSFGLLALQGPGRFPGRHEMDSSIEGTGPVLPIVCVADCHLRYGSDQSRLISCIQSQIGTSKLAIRNPVFVSAARHAGKLVRHEEVSRAYRTRNPGIGHFPGRRRRARVLRFCRRPAAGLSRLGGHVRGHARRGIGPPPPSDRALPEEIRRAHSADPPPGRARIRRSVRRSG